MSYRVVGCARIKVNGNVQTICGIGHSGYVYIRDGVDKTLYICIRRRFGTLFRFLCYQPVTAIRSVNDVYTLLGAEVNNFEKLNVVASYQNVSASLNYLTSISSSGTCFNVFDNEAVFVLGLNRFRFGYSGSTEYGWTIPVHSYGRMIYLGIFRVNNYANLCIFPDGDFDKARAYAVGVSGYSLQDAWVYVTNCEDCYALPGGFVRVPWADIDATGVNLEF
ncbi:MAG: hypothetical protein QXQ91_01880 [Nanopusillaceae archaeon]